VGRSQGQQAADVRGPCPRDRHRQEIDGFGYKDCEVFEAGSIRHEIHWNGRSLNEPARQTLRIAFYLQDADLFTFVAGEQ
jgi:hypothetical protein